MASVRTRLLLAAATLVGGILAGGIVDRSLVAGPAWHSLGADAWAQFSRHADLGAGLVLYPLEGIGAALLIVAAAVSYRFDASAPRAAALPLYGAAAFSIAGLLLTMKAAPIMLALGAAQSSDIVKIDFAAFHFWGLYLRGTTDFLAFLAEVWAFTVLSRPDT